MILPSARKSFQSGQVLLIVILIMIVVLTIVLSLATRSITNLRLTSEEQESQRALSAAEAGIEQALKQNTSIGSPLSLGNNSSIKQVSLTSLSGANLLINNGIPVSRDDGSDVWFIDHSADGTPNYSTSWAGSQLTVNWGKSGEVCTAGSSNTMAALEIIVVSGPIATPQATRYVYDPCDSPPDRRASNNFSVVTRPGDPIGGMNFAYKAQINGLSNALFARIIPLYGDTVVGVATNVALPIQGTIVDAVGEAGNSERRVTSFRGFPKLPTEFFPYGIFIPRS